ncbi:MAG: hypothetical protein GF311_05850 [Candidatus Lokiarchaeota archaeon]|nr:hypothetical protein [Candidatus Lokiarchaeota archaeon]
MYYSMGESISWMPKWIGKKYSKLWSRFEDNLFTYQEAHNLLGEYTSNYLSEMKKSQTLFVFRKLGRKRKYRLIHPELYVYSFTHKLNLNWLSQTYYANLILLLFKLLKEEMQENLLSLGIFGSVARGNAKKDSDLDVFIILNELNASLLERTKLFLKIKRQHPIKNELTFLRSYDINPKLNAILRNRNELKLSFFTIDISFDMKIVYDNNVLQEFLDSVLETINENNIERKYLKDGKYYLDLNLKLGEVFEF